MSRIVEDLSDSFDVLEVATGTGNIAVAIAGKSAFVHGVDFSAEMIRIAREKAERLGVSNVWFSISNAYGLEFPDSTFDAVVMSNAVHVMERTEKALEEARRVLKREGMLVAPTYCHGQNLRSQIVSRLMGITGFRAYHRFTIQSYCALFEASGFNIEKSDLLPDVIPVAYVLARKIT